MFVVVVVVVVVLLGGRGLSLVPKKWWEGADVKLPQLTKSHAGQMRWGPNLQTDLNHHLIIPLKV